MNDAHWGLARIRFLVLGGRLQLHGELLKASFPFAEVAFFFLLFFQVDPENKAGLIGELKSSHQVHTLRVLKPPCSVQGCLSCGVHCGRGDRR